MEEQKQAVNISYNCYAEKLDVHCKKVERTLVRPVAHQSSVLTKTLFVSIGVGQSCAAEF